MVKSKTLPLPAKMQIIITLHNTRHKVNYLTCKLNEFDRLFKIHF